MYIVIAAITASAGLIWALSVLQRSGFDLNSLNPFLAYRRWQWRGIYGGKPIYKLDRPMDVAAAANWLSGQLAIWQEVEHKGRSICRSIYRCPVPCSGQLASSSTAAPLLC